MVRAKNGETIAQCLEGLYVENDTLTACGTLVEEWSAIKKAWFTMAKEVHPDKGGAAADFRAAQASAQPPPAKKKPIRSLVYGCALHEAP